MDSRQLTNDPEEAARIAQEGHQSKIWTAMPGIVTQVNSDNTLSVQPATQGTILNDDESTQNVNLPLLIHVPVCFPKAGGFVLTFPTAIGDEVLVIIASRCIDAWWQLGGIQPPLELRMHDLSDGFAIPGPASLPNKIPNVSTTDAQLRSMDGETYLSIAPGGIIKMKAPNGFQIIGDMVVTGEVTANGIPLSTHIHPGVTTGGGDTGVPLP